MTKSNLPLEKISVRELFESSEQDAYEIPVYQRNYAWENDEITSLIQDVFDSFRKNPEADYYIGTLVTYHKEDNVYEVIDGQQRLTTIRLILGVFTEMHLINGNLNSKLTYRARRKSDNTLKHIPDFSNLEERDEGIVNGYHAAEEGVRDIIPDDKERKSYVEYFLNHVCLIRYKVPKDIDLNQYFEVMNSRGEQLEMHEIVKANLMQRLNTDDERRVFHLIWDACSNMSVYIQQNLETLSREGIFGKNHDQFLPHSFDEIMAIYHAQNAEGMENRSLSIMDIIQSDPVDEMKQKSALKITDSRDSFQPIIDFPNFLLIVLKIVRIHDHAFNPAEFNLDDKELLHEFGKKDIDVKYFSYILLKSRFLLDNYIVHHGREDDTLLENPWKLQIISRSEGHDHPKNLSVGLEQEEMVHLLSMFEVSFTARQRKNYLFYCLLYLIDKDAIDLEHYRLFIRKLADSYFRNVYLNPAKLNARNVPLPGSFDEVILNSQNELESYLTDPEQSVPFEHSSSFDRVYGDGTEPSNGVPLFVFNYADYVIWKLYADHLRGERLREENSVRKEFFHKLGCSDFGLVIFDQFYFSRTRRSLEHFYPQANATGVNGKLNEAQINCFGNYAMIGAEANSSGSNWSPETKLDHYLDESGKISRVSVASLKFMIMLQICKDNKESPDHRKWDYAEILDHQKHMTDLMLNSSDS